MKHIILNFYAYVVNLKMLVESKTSIIRGVIIWYEKIIKFNIHITLS